MKNTMPEQWKEFKPNAQMKAGIPCGRHKTSLIYISVEYSLHILMYVEYMWSIKMFRLNICFSHMTVVLLAADQFPLGSSDNCLICPSIPLFDNHNIAFFKTLSPKLVEWYYFCFNFDSIFCCQYWYLKLQVWNSGLIYTQQLLCPISMRFLVFGVM